MIGTYIAIDIGTTAIKAVEKNDAGRPLRWGILEKPGEPLHTNIRPFDPRVVGGYLRQLVRKMGAETTTAVASVPAFLTITALADFPDERFVPAAPGSFRLSVSQLPDGRFFLRALPNDVMERYEKAFEVAGLELKHLEMESFAAANLLADGPGRTLIADIGKRATTFTVAENRRVIFTKHSDFALASNAPDVILEEADNIAKRYGVKRKIWCGGGARRINPDGVAIPNAMLTIANGLQRTP